jgi:hypothetical protein
VIRLVGLGLLDGLHDVVVLDLADPHESGEKKGHRDGNQSVQACGPALPWAALLRFFNAVDRVNVHGLRIDRQSCARPLRCRHAVNVEDVAEFRPSIRDIQARNYTLSPGWGCWAGEPTRVRPASPFKGSRSAARFSKVCASVHLPEHR